MARQRCWWEMTPMGSRESLPAVARRGGREKSGSSRQYTIPLSRFGPRRCVKPYALVDYMLVFLSELWGVRSSKRPNPPPGRQGPPFIGEGLPQWHTGGGKGTVL